MFYARRGKRALDLVGAVAGLVLLSPLMLLVAAAVRIGMGSPVLFRQARPGLGGRLFTLYKFRTMTADLDANGHPRPDANRLTSLGRFLRSTSLDELPELWNVVTGEMSLVGPRPLLPEYLTRYTPRQARRHEVRPGITGWAQVNGRNAVSWESKFEMDAWYVERLSLALDVKIFFRTIGQILLRRGIHQPGHATAREFTGSVHS